MDRSTLKENAKKVIGKNHWLSVAVAFFMMLGVSSGPSFNFDFSNDNTGGEFYFGTGQNFTLPFFGNIDFESIFAGLSIFAVVMAIASVLIFSSFRCGGIRFFLKLRKDNDVEFTEIFQNLKDKTFLQIAKHTFFKELFIILWTFLFIIPGFIKMFEYWAIEYILAVRPNIERKELFRLSKELMDGHKAECFVLSLSFFGWQILNTFTAGLLGIFWLNPYKEATFVEFFSEIRREAIEKGKITPNDIPDYNFPEPTQPFGSPFMNNAHGNFYDTPENAQYTAPQAPMNNQSSQYTAYIPPMNTPSGEQNNTEDIPQQNNTDTENPSFNNDSVE